MATLREQSRFWRGGRSRGWLCAMGAHLALALGRNKKFHPAGNALLHGALDWSFLLH